jgi:transaldolase
MIDVYADGADYNGIIEAARNNTVKGFTTNPTLMRAAGVTDYTKFARDIIPHLKSIRPDTNISLEVFADDSYNIIRQARIIDEWSKEFDYPVYVKIPVMNTKGEANYQLIADLSRDNIMLNVTAVFTTRQTTNIMDALMKNKTQSIISIFAGRIADTLEDPEKIVHDCTGLKIPEVDENIKFLWASCREPFNLVQAERSGCDIITMTPDQIKKLNLKGKDLFEYSRETVEMFFNDANKSGYTL